MDLPRLQQLRPAPVPGEADPADRPERDPRRLAAGLRRRAPGAQLALRRGLLPRHPHGAGEGPPGEAYNVGGPDECENIEVVKRVVELTGADESLIEYVADRPGHDRRYSLAARRSASNSAGRRRCASPRGWRGPWQWYRENEEWWGPIRSGEYREYYERQYGRALG